MKYTRNEIILEARQVKEFIETNKKIPMSCTMKNGDVISPYSLSLLIAKTILNKEYSFVGVVKYNTNPYSDKVRSLKVKKNTYMDMLQRFANYCAKNRRVPSNIIIDGEHGACSFELFLYCICKILVYYSENKVLPNYCIFNASNVQNTKTNTQKTQKSTSTPTSNCTNPYVSTPYNSKSGCDNMGQNTNYYCGVSALQKVLYKFGIHVSQKQLASWAGTTTSGTSHQGIRTAVAQVSKKYGVKLTVKEYNFSELGFEKVAKMICKPNVDIIWHLSYRNKYGHYEKVLSIDLNKKTMKIINSLGNKCANNCFCGYIETRSFEKQKQYCNGISQPSLIVITKG